MQTIGERLEEARKRKGISIREAAEATKVRGDYLHKFESNQFDIKLPEIYVRGFLRLYGNFLKLPGDKLVSDYLALGLGEGGRPQGKGLNREIYGKMEISHSGASSAKKNEPPPPHPLSGDDSPRASAPQRQPFQPRMPLGGLDRALLAKNGVWIGLGGVLVLGLVIWGVVAFVGRRPAETPSSPPTTQSQPVEEPVYLMALRPVQVTSVKGRLDGVELAAPRALVTGERLPLPNADMAIGVSDRSAVQFEFKGVRYGGGTSTGPGVLTLNFTAQR
jgi:transcriptional regulator with XRE-family HTH domain